MKLILTAFFRTMLEAVDSKKATAAFTGALASSLVLIAGKQGWTWLDADTSKLIAGAIVVKGVAFILAQAHVDANQVAPTIAAPSAGGIPSLPPPAQPAEGALSS